MNRGDRAGSALSTVMLRRQGVVRALEAMRLGLAEQMSLEYLAKTAAMSRFHFERVFHQVTGLSPFQFLAAMRLVRARELVLNTDASITAICFDVGYNSVGTFTRRFTASVGVSPRRLRRFSHDRLESTTTTRPGIRRYLPGRGPDIVVHCRGAADNTRIFVGAFPTPVPIGRPEVCATCAGTGTVVLRSVPPGAHYLLGAARPAGAAITRFGDVETLVGVVAPAPILIEGHAQHEVTMQLRPIEVTDPPVVSFLPLLFHENRAYALHDEGCAHALLDEGCAHAPNDDAPPRDSRVALTRVRASQPPPGSE